MTRLDNIMTWILWYILISTKPYPVYSLMKTSYLHTKSKGQIQKPMRGKANLSGELVGGQMLERRVKSY